MIDALKAQRAVNRSAITRLHGQLQGDYQKAMEGAAPGQNSNFEIGVKFEKIDKAATTIVIQDQQIIQEYYNAYNKEEDKKLKENMNQQILDSVQRCQDYSDLVCEAKHFFINIKQKWAELDALKNVAIKTVLKEEQGAASESTDHSHYITLEKTKLEVFSGERGKFRPFWSKFDVTVDSNRLMLASVKWLSY